MYRIKPLFEYAAGYYMILPDDTIYFKPDTPEDIKERFTKDWAEHLKEVEERHKNGDYSE
ncbi:MAG: hypothetical protein Q8865_04085 [Bacillota bacterium]|nr:hypothetical protein [Bacillota bacterium]